MAPTYFWCEVLLRAKIPREPGLSGTLRLESAACLERERFVHVRCEWYSVYEWYVRGVYTLYALQTLSNTVRRL